MSMKSAAIVSAIVFAFVLSLMAGTPASAQTFLAQDQLRPTFAGKTMKFPDFRTKKPIFIFLKEDGGFDMKFSGRKRSGKWWIGDDATFCREYSDGSRRSCQRVSMDGSKAVFYRRGKKSYAAELLPGNQLP
jgi:hypothetical protein